MGCLVGATRAEPVEIDGVVATVGRSAILRTELAERAKQEQGAKPSETLDRMIEELLLVDLAVKRKIVVTEDDLERAITEIKTSNGLGDKQFEDALKDQGYTLESYRTSVRRQLLVYKVMNYELRPNIIVTDAEIEARYKEKKAKVGDGIKSLEDLKETLRQELYSEKLESGRKKLVGELRQEAHIVIRL